MTDPDMDRLHDAIADGRVRIGHPGDGETYDGEDPQ